MPARPSAVPARSTPAQPAPATAAGTTERWSRLEGFLLAEGVVSREALLAARARQAGAKRPLPEILVEQGVDEALMLRVLAARSSLPVAQAADLVPDPAVQDLVPAQVVQRLGIVPLKREGDTLVIATCDPFQLPAFDEIRDRTGLRVRAVLGRPSAVRAAIGKAREGEEALDDILKNHGLADAAIHITPEGPVGPDVGGSAAAQLGLEGLASDGPVVRFVNFVLIDAIRQGASDVHVEAEQDALRVRFRVDGELREVQRVPAGVRNLVTSRLKVVAGLNLIECRRPQDGRAKVRVAGQSYDLRVSTIPSYFGEKVVVRILNPGAAVFDLDRSGLEAQELSAWRALLKRPHGLVLVTGPTGSGKTSTLYASLLELRDPSLNLVTVEDPVEFQFPGVVHVPVRHDIGMTFAAALRSILRQDPDIVLVGEIRDRETAEVAIQAALTGHLVLSTLHTNDALGAVTRLLDLGVAPQLVSSALTGVLAQRLVRRVCEGCGVPHEWPAEALARLGVPAGASGRRGPGCAACRGTGLKGRAAVAELVVPSPDLRRLILAGGGEETLREQARRDGWRSLLEVGRAKVLAGQTVPEEVLSIAQAESERAPAPAPSAAAPVVVPGPGAGTWACAHCGQPDLAAAKRHCTRCGTPAPVPTTAAPVLVCDDNLVQRKLVAAALADEPGGVIEAVDGQTCLDAVARAKPALVVIDQNMPGLTGIEVIRRIRSCLETATLPIVMLTGSAAEDFESIVFEAGADDYLTKPVTPDRLRARVRALLSARRRWSGSA